MLKRTIIIFCCLFLAVPVACFAEMDLTLEEQYQASGGTAIDDYYHRELEEMFSQLFPDFSPKKAVEAIVTGRVTQTPSSLLRWLGTLLWGEWKACISSFGLLLILVVLSGIAEQMNQTGGNSAEAASAVCGAVICAVVAKLFDESVQSSRDAIVSMSEFVTVLTPVMSTLMTGAGQVTGAALLNPMLYSTASFSINAVSRWIIPAVYGCFLLCAANSLSGSNPLDGFVGLIKNFMKWLLTAILTLFSGLTAVYSAAGQNVDVMVSKTARFTVGQFVPVVGGMLSESVELVLSLSSVLRRGVGIAGMIVLLLIFAHTAVSLTIQFWMFRIGAAFSSPLGSPLLGKLLSDTASCVGMMLASLCVCAVLFCFILMTMITVGRGGIV